ncbi:DUF3427 domain-containing protein [Clostridia bacterium]|nr:DUF3427 domain-containing protein [Clostridia bacterium]
MDLVPGTYEQIVNRIVEEKLEGMCEQYTVSKTNLEVEEYADTLALYMQKVIVKSLKKMKGKMHAQTHLCNQMVDVLYEHIGDAEILDAKVDESVELLLSIFSQENREVRPATSLSTSSLFTGSKHEPSMMHELKKEIATSDRIDMLISFIRWSGLRNIIDELRLFTSDPTKKLRIITTTYMGATQYKAIEELSKLPNTEIRISYNTKSTRLHAKSYIFHRRTGFSTAYIGSSNLSNAAISSGLEWNLKICEYSSEDVMNQLCATFETYWHDRVFSPFNYLSQTDQNMLKRALKKEQTGGAEGLNFVPNLFPFPYQQEILDKLQTERLVHNRYRNLVVAATGTGKTMIAAFDYKQFRKENKKARLLFIAHRKEILKQSRSCFRQVLRDYNFGELLVGEYEPLEDEYLFASIQSINSRGYLEKHSKDYYDYIVIDETHHGAANSYRRVLEYFEPKVLLGLTATPERMDNQDIRQFFDEHFAAEIRLGEAIDQKLLSPFQYFAITDSESLENLTWRAGGYIKDELVVVYSKNRQRANLVIDAVHKYLTDVNETRAIGFCVNKDHAEFMSYVFNKAGIKSAYLTADSDKETRNNVKSKLEKKEIQFIFVVDLYNEGVDIPCIDTVVFLRPTESLTVFLQQLGRGLRLDEEKDCLTVLDFVGQANKNYRLYEQKIRALCGPSSRSVEKEIQLEFPSLPAGCCIYLEKVAKEHILESIRNNLADLRWLRERMKEYIAHKRASSGEINQLDFMSYADISMESFYSNPNRSFTKLLRENGIGGNTLLPSEEKILKSIRRLLHINSKEWLTFLLSVFKESKGPYNEYERKMLLMFHWTVWQKKFSEIEISKVEESIELIKSNKDVAAEICNVLQNNIENLTFIEKRVDLGFSCPINVHARYNRSEILTAIGYNNEEKNANIQNGVLEYAEKKLILLFVTLNKIAKEFSPTTMYDDYAIDPYHFHWQSPNSASELTPQGKLLINHKEKGYKVLLFVREFKTEHSGVGAAFHYLGPVQYISHDGGKPMNMLWRMEYPIPSFIERKAAI